MFQSSVYVVLSTFQFSKAGHIAKICVGEVMAYLPYMQWMHEEKICGRGRFTVIKIPINRIDPYSI